MATVKQAKASQELRKWVGLVEALARQVESWAQQRNWLVHRDTKRIKEPNFGAYTVPVLGVRAPSGPIYLDPVARQVGGADGRVDLITWPTMQRVMLVRKRGKWKVKTEWGVERPGEWNQRTFEQLVDHLNDQT